MRSTLAIPILLAALVPPASATEPASPYPPSPVIAGIDWAPADTIVRQPRIMPAPATTMSTPTPTTAPGPTPRPTGSS